MEKKGRRKLTITLYRHTLLDMDNAYFSCKKLTDLLVQRGLLVDDSPKWIDYRVEQVKVGRTEAQRTVVEIEEVG